MRTSTRPGMWMTGARSVWIVAFGAVVVLFLAGTPATYTHLHGVCPSARCDDWQLTRIGMASLHPLGLNLDQYATILIAINLLSAALWLTLGLLLFLRAGSDRMALVAAFFLVLLTGGTFGGIIATLAVVSPTWQLPVDVVEFFGQLSIAVFFLVFPDGRLIPRWSGWLIVPAALMALSPVYATIFPALGPYSTLLNGLGAILYLAVVAIQIHRYRRVSTESQQRQTRWVLLGGSMTALGIAAIVAFQIVGGASLSASAQQGALLNLAVYAAWYAVMAPIPLSIVMAITRSRLWDIDVLINRTLVYGSLTLSLAGVYIGGVIAIQAMFGAATGQSSDLAVAIATLTVAALFNPWRRRLQTFIDRRFYRRKYDASRVLAAFTSQLRDEVDLEQLAGDLASVVNETVQPSSVSLWVRPGGQNA